MRDDGPIGVDERELDDAALEALADAHAIAPPVRVRDHVLAAARDELRGRRTRQQVRRWRAVGTVAAALALMLAALALRQNRIADDRTVQLGALARTNAELSARLDEQGRTLAELREAVAAQAQVLRVLAGPRTLTATLAPQAGRSGSGRVVVDSTTGEGAIVLAGLEPPGPGRTYELWAIRGSRPPEPAGLLPVELGRPTAARVQTVERPTEVTAFAVSIEPAGGSSSPTGPIVMVGPVAS